NSRSGLAICVRDDRIMVLPPPDGHPGYPLPDSLRAPRRERDGAISVCLQTEITITATYQ
ncbi:hypothetical protein, partial [Klebsiella pneumoniae]|uniref:hypothetical protein n=1 Tax=Klebsiella pneumoniae TaxID=573 RepID=UPI001C4009AA